MWQRISVGAGLALLLVVAACAPAAQDSRPRLAVLNAPTEVRAAGAAEQFTALLAPLPEAAAFGFTPRASLRYHETYRDMQGERAPLQAAFAARAVGAAYAVMVGLELTRDLLDYRYAAGELTVWLEVRGRAVAQLVDPATAQVRGRYASQPVTARFSVRETFLLPDGATPESDRGREALRRAARSLAERAEVSADLPALRAALAEVAPPVARTVASLVAAD
jgi:hypothetical protein